MSIRRLTTFFLYGLALITLLSATSRADTSLPDQFTAVYKAKLGPIELAQMTRKLYQNDEGHYVFESHSKPMGYARWLTSSELRERSEWIYHNGIMRPLSYFYDRSGDKKRYVEINFDWEHQRATNKINHDPWHMTIPDGTLDKLLYHLAIIRDLELGKQKFEYQIADGGTLKTVHFEYLGEEVLETKLGKFTTVKMYHPGKRKENDTWLWFAKELGYFPVQIEQQKGNGTVMVTLQSLEGISRRPARAAETSPIKDGD